MPSVAAAHRNNLEMAKSDQFVEWMRCTLTAEYVRVFRLHCAGDFFSPEYVQKWHEIVSRRKQIQFFAYSRSWRVPEQLPELIRLSQLPNMALWWSIDRETGPAPLIQGIRRAYMAINDIDAANAPDDCDLVFRDNPKTILKKANGILVCPAENGVTGQLKHTCSSCGICWNGKTAPRWEPALLDRFDPYEDGIEIQAPEIR